MIRLRVLNKSDLGFLSQIENNPDFMHFGEVHEPFSQLEFIDFIEQSKVSLFVSGQYRYVVEYKNEAAGFLDLFDYNKKKHSASVGIIIAPEYRKKGIALLALKKLENIANVYWDIKVLKVLIAQDNVPSIHLFKKLQYIKHKEISYYKIGFEFKRVLIYKKIINEL